MKLARHICLVYLYTRLLVYSFTCILVYLFTKNRLFYTFKNTPQRYIARSRANTMAKLPNVSHAS